ncbi:hypothetical protein [Teichococcus aestuarii]|uniref:hypothetical protein n=1 Tax=Teichococcus aestuarii TaxID=568898 RepID=UPI003618D9F8
MPRRKPDLIQTAMADPNFRLLPRALKGFWVELVELLLASPTPGRVCFLGSVFASVSRLVSISEPISETDVETHLETFARLGLIELDREANAILSATYRAESAKAEAARNNGKNGGRPRKGESKEEALARRQGNLMLPVTGGRSETQETDAEPIRESSRAVTTTSSSKEVGSTAREAAASVSLGHELAEIAGMNAVSGGYDFSWVRGWLSQGATPDMIRQAVRAVAARKGYSGAGIHTFKYFDGAVQRTMQQRAAKPAGGDELLQSMAEDDYRARMIAYAQSGKGPRPSRAA